MSLPNAAALQNIAKTEGWAFLDRMSAQVNEQTEKQLEQKKIIANLAKATFGTIEGQKFLNALVVRHLHSAQFSLYAGNNLETIAISGLYKQAQSDLVREIIGLISE